MKKYPIVSVLIVITLIAITINTARFFDVKGYYNESTGVYKNKYLNMSVVTLPNFYVDKTLTASRKNSNEVNLFKMKNYVYIAQEKNDKVEIISNAKKLDLNFEKYCKMFFLNESNKNGIQSISEIKKEEDYISQEYKDKYWYYKIYLLEKKGYVINITIKYQDLDNKDLYLSYINYITELN